MIVWDGWVKLCGKINSFFVKFFYNWAGLIGRNPKKVIGVTVVVSLALSAGFIRINIQNHGERLYFEQSNTATRHLDRSVASFSAKAKINEFILAMKTGDSIFSEKAFKAALLLHNGILKTRYNEICIRANKTDPSVNGCLMVGPLELFQYDESKITDVSIPQVLLSRYNNDELLMVNGRPASFNLKHVLGQFNIKSNVISSTAMRMQYYIYYSENDDMYKKQSEIEKDIIDFLEAKETELEADGILLYFNVGRSIDDNISESSGGDIKYVVVSITLMCTFTALVLTKLKDRVGGHFWLGMLGIGCVMLGIGSSFGLVIVSGQYFVAFVGVLPFLVLGVGIDDMFIIVDALDHVDEKIRGIARLQQALADVGASVTMTTLTDLVAFAVSASTVFPAIQYFCTYAALSIFFVYLLIISLLIAGMALDIKRIEGGKMDLIPCKAVQGYEPWKKTQTLLSNRVMYAWGRFLMKLPVRIVVVVVCFGLLGAGIWGATQVDEKFDLRQLATDNSYFVDFLDARVKYFPIGYQISIINDRPLDYTLESNQNAYRNLSNICQQSVYFKANDTYNWMKEFLDSTTCIANRNNCTGRNFYPNLHSFLQRNPMYYADLKFTSTRDSITASRIVCFEKDIEEWSWKKDAMIAIRDDIESKTSLPDIFPVSVDYFFRHQIVVVRPETIRNLLICALAVLVITTPYLVHPVIILLVFLGFVALVFELFALMAAWNVALNSISMIVSIMAIGFAVDYSAHIAHAFLLSNAPTPEERIIHALGDIGASVLMGGISTFLGVVVTGFGTSEIFRIFFRMVFGIVVIGLLNGLLFLPVLLSIFCRNKVQIASYVQSHENNGDVTMQEVETKEGNEVIENPNSHIHTEKNIENGNDWNVTVQTG